MLEEFTPRLYRGLQQFSIHTRRKFLGTRQGSHSSPRRGHGLEFADYRPYTAGDDFRHIDWGAYGRTDRLYVRQFVEEQSLNVLFLIDGSGSMAFPKQGRKFWLAKNLSLAIAYVALSDGDAVTFALLGQQVTPQYTGPQALRRAAQAIEKVTPEGRIDFVNEVRAALATQKIPGKCFLVSDFLFPEQQFVEALDLIRAKNFDVSVLHILSPTELKLDTQQAAFLAVDAETGEEIELLLDQNSKKEYATRLASHVAQLEAYCARVGVAHVLISSQEPLAEIVLTRLPELGLLR